MRLVLIKEEGWRGLDLMVTGQARYVDSLNLVK